MDQTLKLPENILVVLSPDLEADLGLPAGSLSQIKYTYIKPGIGLLLDATLCYQDIVFYENLKKIKKGLHNAHNTLTIALYIVSFLRKYIFKVKCNVKMFCSNFYYFNFFFLVNRIRNRQRQN